MTTTIMAKLAFISIALMTVLNTSAQTGKLQEEKELEVVNFQSIKKVLQQDGLSKEAQEKKKQVVQMKKVQNVVEASRFMYPTEEEMWSFLSEYWLIKNAQILSWDFEKPDYGLEKSFKTMLENLGFYQKKFKILLLNSPTVVRATLPTANNEFIALISVPFIRSLDLSKLEISLMLLEDFFRNEAGYFKQAVATDKLKKLSGTNFQATGVDLSMIQEIMKNYDKQVNQKGFTFQQQFEITKKMDAFLKASPELWNGYFRMLGKIDRFTKANQQYKDYIRLYPSPEMQVKWLSPEEKAL